MSQYNDKSNRQYIAVDHMITSCGARTYLHIPAEVGTYEAEVERLRPILEEENEELRRSLYRDILDGRRTVEEIVAQIQEHVPQYRPHMVPMDTIFQE